MVKILNFLRTYIGVVVLGLMLLAWGCYALLTHSFGPERQGSLTAQLYDLDGAVVGETTVTFDGRMNWTLLSRDTPIYIGTFEIGAVPETGPGKYTEAPEVQIRWIDAYTSEQLLRYYPFNLPSTDFGLQNLMLDAEMSEVAVTLEDGRVLATSEEWYQLYRDRLDRLAEVTQPDLAQHRARPGRLAGAGVSLSRFCLIAGVDIALPGEDDGAGHIHPEEQAEAAHGADHPDDAHQRGVDAEVLGHPAAHAADHAVPALGPVESLFHTRSFLSS